jgi:hypothetical protein
MAQVPEENYWSAVAVLGKLGVTQAELTGLGPCLAGLDPGVLYQRIVASRVYTAAERSLAEVTWPGADVVLARLRQLGTDEAERRRRARPHVLAILRAAGRFRVRVIKGMALRELYPEPALRHEGDLDVHVPAWPDALALAEWLRQSGWCWDTQEFPWLKWTDHGHIYGQLSLVLPGNRNAFARADVHIGPFSVGHCGLLPMPGWQQGEVLGVPVTVPDRETSIALLVAHSVNDGIVSMKDLNDLHLLLSGRAGPDWASVEELCRSFGGLAALAQLLATLAATYPGEHDGGGSVPGYLAFGSETPDGRADRFAHLARQDELSRGAGAEEAERTADEARRYFSAALTPHLSQEVNPGPEDGLRSRRLCWRLLPRESWAVLGDTSARVRARSRRNIAPGLELARSQAGAVVIVGAEYFVPTVWGGVHPESIALAATLAGPA